VGAPVDAAKVFRPLAGSFTGPGLDEMVGDISCTPEGSDLGARVLLRRAGGVFTIVRFLVRPDSHDTLHACQALRTAQGRDLAVCRLGAVSYGELDDSVVAFDYTKVAGEEMSTLVSLADTSGTACSGATDLLVGEIESVALVDVNHDGNKDVRVIVRAAKIHVPRQPPCAEMARSFVGPRPPNLRRPPPQTIDFIAQGAVLTPTPAGARILKALEAMGRP
jgi:hypothetical protein